MFPISDSIKSARFPLITLVIIAINIYVFYLELTSGNQNAFISQYALTPARVNFLDPNSLSYFITSLFLHGGFIHILSNMWFLWVFGDNVEAHFGKIKYTLLFLASGIGGNFLQYLINPTSTIPMLGASGAISGILASYLVLFPSARIKTFLVLFFFITITEIPAMIYIFYWFFIQFLSGIASLPLDYQGGVAFWAHVGGFVTGYILANKFKRSASDKEFIEGEIVG